MAKYQHEDPERTTAALVGDEWQGVLQDLNNRYAIDAECGLTRMSPLGISTLVIPFYWGPSRAVGQDGREATYWLYFGAYAATGVACKLQPAGDGEFEVEIQIYCTDMPAQHAKVLAMSAADHPRSGDLIHPPWHREAQP